MLQLNHILDFKYVMLTAYQYYKNNCFLKKVIVKTTEVL